MNDSVPPSDFLLPEIPDHELIRRIGEGTFGEVWLGRTQATGRLRAIKIIFRQKFADDRPYELEFAGLRRFEEVSREHEGFVDILHISRDDELQHFAYVMELADDQRRGQPLEVEKYRPTTLTDEIEQRGRLPTEECVSIGLALASALIALHQRSLVHRDIKPSNIIFVRGAPKLADIGLVTEANAHDTTLVGTPAYMDTTVHGTPRGDLYSLGRVLYVMATGRKPTDYPQPTAYPVPDSEREAAAEMERIWRKAGDPELARRYRTAEEFHADLENAARSAAERRVERLERIVAALKRFGGVAVALLLLAGVSAFLWVKNRRNEAEMRQRTAGSYVAYGSRAVDENDLLRSLSWFVKALELDQANPDKVRAHRLRIGMVLRNSPSVVQMWFHPNDTNADVSAWFTTNDNEVVTMTPARRWAVHDVVTGDQLCPEFGANTTSSSERLALAPAAGLAVTATHVQHKEVQGLTNYVHVWNFRTGERVGGLTNARPVSVPAISPSGRWVAAADSQFSVLLWDRHLGGAPRKLGRHGTNVQHLAFSPQEDRLVSCSWDRTAKVWSVTNGTCEVVFNGHPSWVYWASFSSNGQWVATSSYDRRVRIWSVTNGLEYFPSLEHGDGVQCVAFSPDATRLVTAGLDFTVRVWKLGESHPLHQFRHISKPQTVSFSPSGNRVVTVDYDGTTRVWDLAHARLEPRFQPLAISGDGQRVATAGRRAVNVNGGPFPLSAPIADTNRLRLELDLDGSHVLILPAVPEATDARLWGAGLGPSGRPVPFPPGFSNLVLSPDARSVLGVSNEIIQVRAMTDGATRLQFQAASLIAFSHAGGRLATASNNTVQVWQVDTGKRVWHQRLAYGSRVRFIEWSPDDTLLMTGCADTLLDSEAARLWDARSGAPVGQPLVHRDGVRHGAFSPDGQRVVTSSEDFTAGLWSVHTNRQRVPPLQHAHQVLYGVFSPDGRWVATACRDGVLRLWDADTGEPLTPPLTPSVRASGLQFLPDARALILLSTNNQTWVLDLPRDERTLTELNDVAQFLACHSFQGQQGMVPTSRETLQGLWKNLRRKFPADFSLIR